MYIRIRKNSFYFAVVVFLLWIPTLIIKYPVINSVVSPLKNLMLIGYAGLFFLRKKRLNTHNIFLLLYLLLFIGITLVLGGDYLYVINSSYKIFFSCILLQSLIYEKESQIFSIIKNVLGIMVITNVVFLLLYPNGIYTIVNVANQYYTVESAWWLFGPKNNTIMWILASNLLSQISIFQNKYNKINIFEGRARNWFDYIVVISTVLTPALTKSSTSLFVMFVMTSVLIFNVFYKTVNSKLLVAGIVGMYIILSITLYSMSSSNLLSFFAGLFGKDATFTGRTSAWANSIVLFSQSPIYGYGYLSSNQMQNMLGAVAFVNTHNTLLQILLNGGLLLEVVFILYLISIIRRIIRVLRLEKQTGVLLIIAVGALFIEMCFEAFTASEQYWLFILLIGMIADKLISSVVMNKKVGIYED